MTTNEHRPIIKVTDLSFSYGAGEVLSGASLVVHEGDYLGIVGPNGGGKTTLLKLILGLLKPARGSVLLFDKEQKLFSERSFLGYVPQKTSSFDVNFPATVLEVVLMGRYAKKGLFHMLNKEDCEAAELSLRRVGMWEHREQLIGNLSGGQEQRVFIARALVAAPKILFLDEQTAGIDHKSQDEFYALLRTLHREEGLTIVLISHDLSAVAREASALAYIDTTLTYYSSPSTFIDNDMRRALAHGHDH